MGRNNLDSELKPSKPTERQICSYFHHKLEEKYPREEFNIPSISDIAKLDNSKLKYIVENLFTKDEKEFNTLMWKSAEAPSEMIARDFCAMNIEGSLMFASKDLEFDLNVRAIAGHAQNRHATFKEDSYENTTTDRVISCLAHQRREIERERRLLTTFEKRSQGYIDEIVTLMDDFLDYSIKSGSKFNPDKKYKTIRKKNISGMTLFKGVKVNLMEMMRGFYFASLMDRYEGIRSEVFNKYGFQMGGGECYQTDSNLLKEQGIWLTHLSTSSYQNWSEFLCFLEGEKREELLYDLGIFRKTNFDWDNIDLNKIKWKDLKLHSAVKDKSKEKSYKNVYHRLHRGKGCSDDIAIVIAGFLPQTFTNLGHIELQHDIPSRIFGAYLADKIDTIEKDSHLIFPNGQDEFVGEYLNRKFRIACQNKVFRESNNIRYRKDGQYDLVSKSTIIDFTAASANTRKIYHSSQRYFLRKENGTCAFKEYLRHAQAYATVLRRDFDYETLNSIMGKGIKNIQNILATFHRVPIKEIIYEMNNRLELVIEPGKREKRLNDYLKELI